MFFKVVYICTTKNKQVHDHNTRTNVDLFVKPCNKVLDKKCN